MDIDAKLAELGIDLPAAPKPLASYVPCVISAGVAYCAGQVPMEDGKAMWTGRVGADVSIEDATAAARRCALQTLAALREALGGFERLERIVRLEVFVASAPGFTGQPQVANGASELLGAVMGDAGVHARAALGVSELPLGVPVEVVVTAAVSGS
jgi:enamine deaminase RidA (YjgF/YER057c/UK114 family)